MLCALALLISAAFAAPAFDRKLIASAKTALTALLAGDTGRVATLLPFADDAPDADEWKSFARGSFSKKGTPQTKYAVAYYSGGRWKIAVPLSEPASADVEVFVLSSVDGETVSGYASADWGEVYGECRRADHVVWQDEYRDIDSAVVEFDD